MAVATGDLFIDGVTDMKQGLNFLVPVTDTGNVTIRKFNVSATCR